jgi:hypothetical protein
VGALAELLDGHLKTVGGVLQKASCSRRTLVVHREIDGAAVFSDGDHLRVLAADIHQCSRSSDLVVHALGVAGYLGDFASRAVDELAPVSGGDQRDGFCHLELGAHLGDDPLGLFADKRVGRLDAPTDQLAVCPHSDDFAGCGARVDAHGGDGCH